MLSFIKEPKDIDEAIYQVVCFQQTKQKNESSVYKNAMFLNHAESNSDSDDKTISRTVPGKKNKHRVMENKSKEATSADSTSTTEDSLNLEKLRDIIRSELKSLTPNNTSIQFKEKVPIHCQTSS